MQTTAIILFAIAAIAGITLASTHLRGKLPPMALALAHGAVAATGLVLLLLVVIDRHGAGLGAASAAVFGVAAIGGFVLFARHIGKKKLPIGLIVGHGLLAVVGFALLLLWAFGSGA